MPNYLITGTSGAGKSAVGEALRSKGLHVVDVDHHSGATEWREIRSDKVATYQPGDGYTRIMELLYCLNPEVVVPLLEKSMRSTDAYFFDVYAQNIQDYYNYFERMFILIGDPDTIKHRLLQRKSGDWGKDAGELRQTIEDLEPYQKKLLDAGAIALEASQSINQIVNQIAGYVRIS